MEVAIIVIVVVAALVGWWLYTRQGEAPSVASSAAVTSDDFSGVRSPSSV